jgi:hypothetical protein
VFPQILVEVSSFEFEEHPTNGKGADNKSQTEEHDLYIRSSFLLFKECFKTNHICRVRIAGMKELKTLEERILQTATLITVS